MTILQALNKVPSDKWKLQVLHDCFLGGTATKKTGKITFQTTPELVLQLNRAAVLGGKVDMIGMIIWVDSEAWEAAKKSDAPPAAAPAPEPPKPQPRLVCPTCKSDRWAEIYPSTTDSTGFTLYCRHCEEGCVTPLKV